MKNGPVYLLAAGLLIAIGGIAFVSLHSVSGLPEPADPGLAVYFWIIGGIMLLGIIAFFLWLISKGK